MSARPLPPISPRLRLAMNLGALVVAMIFGGLITALILPTVRTREQVAPPARTPSAPGPLAAAPAEEETPPADPVIPPPADDVMPSLVENSKPKTVRPFQVTGQGTEKVPEPVPGSGAPGARPGEKPVPQPQDPQPEVVLRNKGLRPVGPLFLLEGEASLKPQVQELDLLYSEWTRLVARMKELEGLAAQQQKLLMDLYSYQQNLMSQYVGLSTLPPGAGVDSKPESSPVPGETDRERQARESEERRKRDELLAQQNAAREERRRQLELEFYQVQARMNEQEYRILAFSNEYNRLFGLAMQKEGEFQKREGDLSQTVDWLRERYVELANDTEVKLALKQLNKDGVKFALGPQGNFKANLEKMKSSLLEEKGLRKRKSGAFFKLQEISDVKTLEFRTKTIDEQLAKAQGKAADWQRAAVYRRKLLGETLEKASQLETRLAKPGPEPSKSRAAADLEEAEARIAKLRKEQVDAEKNRKVVADAVTTSREAYVRSVAAFRKAVDGAKEKLETLRDDPQVKKTKIEPISQVALESLKRAEAAIKTEEIPLEADKTVFRVDAVINGETRKMVLDPGVDVVRISESEAATLGIIPLKADPKVDLEIGNGQTLPARRTQIKSVQIGSLVVSDVECLVILNGYEARPVLGSDFLGHFSSQLDPESGKLTLTQVNLKPPAKPDRRPRAGK